MQVPLFTPSTAGHRQVGLSSATNLQGTSWFLIWNWCLAQPGVWSPLEERGRHPIQGECELRLGLFWVSSAT